MKKLKSLQLSILFIAVIGLMIWTLKPLNFPGKRNPANIYKNVSDSDNLNLNIFLDIIKNNNFKNIEQVLEYFGKNYPEFFENHTFAFKSPSLHGSSYQNPRAIVYGKSADFIITFNGSDDQKNFNKLEVTQFNSKKKHYEFFEISFNRKPNIEGHYLHASKSGGPNNVCMSCHAGNKPIWDTYDLWPGVYGSVDGEPVRMSRKFLPSILSFSRNEYLAGEKALWNTFSSYRRTHPRYKWLPEPLADQAKLPISGGPFLPNATLSVTLTRKNMERVLRSLELNKSSVTSKVAREVMFSFDCRRVQDKLLKTKMKELNDKYETEIQSIEEKLRKRMVNMLIRYSDTPYFSTGQLIESLFYNNFSRSGNLKAYSFFNNNENEQKVFTENINKIHGCMMKNRREGIRETANENRLDYKGCIKRYRLNPFKNIVLKDFFKWSVEEKIVTTKTKAGRIARAVAILKSNNAVLNTDQWSTLLSGAHDYSSGSGVEDQLFRNGFSNIFYPTEIKGDRSAFGEYLLSKKGNHLSAKETDSYCSALASKITL